MDLKIDVGWENNLRTKKIQLSMLADVTSEVIAKEMSLHV